MAQPSFVEMGPETGIGQANHATLSLDFSGLLGQTRVMDAKAFQHTHRVTYADCTMGDHIYYARYLDLLEAARGEFFRHLGVTFREWQERDVIFPVVECRLVHKSPARYDDLLAIRLWPTTAERIRLDFGYRVENQSGALVMEGETRHVCTGSDEKLKRLPEELIKFLQPWLEKRD